MANKITKGGVETFSGEGGGVKAVMQLAICAEAEKLTGISASDYFQVYGGTSAGALVAASLASGKTAAESLEIFNELCEKVFPQISWKQFLDSPLTTLGQVWKTFNSLGGFASNKYDPTPLKESLEKNFGDLTLADLLKPLIVPVYNANLHHTEVLSTIDAQKDPSSNYKLVDVLLGTTAAPGYFPAAKVVNSNFTRDSVWIDGGMLANSPSLTIYNHLEEHQYTINTMNYFSSEEEYVKGYSPRTGQLYIGRNAKDWLIDGIQRDNEKAILKKLGDKLITFSVPIPDELSKLDNSSPQNMKKLIEVATDHVLPGGLGNGYFKAFVDNIIKNNLTKCQSTLDTELYKEWFNSAPPTEFTKNDDLSSVEQVIQEKVKIEDLLEKELVTKDPSILTTSIREDDEGIDLNFEEITDESGQVLSTSEQTIPEDSRIEGLTLAKEVPSFLYTIDKGFSIEDLGYISGDEDEEESAYDQLCGHQMADDGAPALEGIDPEPMDIEG